ncbi:MAG: 1-acyl-sn-glycerol-3-phosphate acyltransferase [Halomonadaceae bacterium]|nr:MAG: 1-acyl-sn-glycerol-3-phosphate acyltransferase [Halomonadaceae bacterium]
MNPLRAVLLAVSFICASLISLPLCLARPFHRDNNRLCSRLYAAFGLPCLGLKVRLEGKEHLPVTEPRVIIANHQSNLDLFVMGRIVPSNAVVVGKQSLSLVPLFGQLFWLGGNVLIRRSNRRQAMAAMKASQHALLKRRRSVWIFPEGTRSRGNGLLPFKKGAFHTAIAAAVPITMICVSDYGRSLASRGQQPPQAHVRVLPPVATAHLKPSDAMALMAQCQAAMAAELADLNGQPAINEPGSDSHTRAA